MHKCSIKLYRTENEKIKLESFIIELKSDRMKVTSEVTKNVERRLQQDYNSYHFNNIISIINILIIIRTERSEGKLQNLMRMR